MDDAASRTRKRRERRRRELFTLKTFVAALQMDGPKHTRNTLLAARTTVTQGKERAPRLAIEQISYVVIRIALAATEPHNVCTGTTVISSTPYADRPADLDVADLDQADTALHFLTGGAEVPVFEVSGSSAGGEPGTPQCNPGIIAHGSGGAEDIPETGEMEGVLLGPSVLSSGDGGVLPDQPCSSASHHIPSRHRTKGKNDRNDQKTKRTRKTRSTRKRSLTLALIFRAEDIIEEEDLSLQVRFDPLPFLTYRDAFATAATCFRCGDSIGQRIRICNACILYPDVTLDAFGTAATCIYCGSS
jgi:hypothetical protein